MPIEETSKNELIKRKKVLEHEYKNDYQKIEFFDNHKEAFFGDLNTCKVPLIDNIPKDIDDAFYVYANMKRMNEKELEELKKLKWEDYPRNLKIFLFDFCISS
tara:strand:- start:163 stop:471 length:309 start_codon:yes stop_codon:yes gene_type:complete